MENKQTAVDFIFSQLPDEYTTTRQGFEVYKQAKQMENDQMINFADNYVDNCVIPNENMAIPTIMDMPNYYSEKYGKTFIDLVSDEESQVHEVVRKLKEKKN
jgi:hypothetical protein